MAIQLARNTLRTSTMLHRSFSILPSRSFFMLNSIIPVSLPLTLAQQVNGTRNSVLRRMMSSSSNRGVQQNFIRIGDKAPNFKAETTTGPIDFHEYIGNSWLLLFSHPAAMTPVCTTELGTLARLKKEFDKRNARIIALSTDTVGENNEWIKDINDTQKTTMNYPIIADKDRQIAALYGMLDQTHISGKSGQPLAVRSVFIIDPEKTVRLVISYPASTGRNFNEILRVLDSLQMTRKHKLATPADWNPGDDAVVVPSVSTEDAKKMFGKVNELRPYLRTVSTKDLH